VHSATIGLFIIVQIIKGLIDNLHILFTVFGQYSVKQYHCFNLIFYIIIMSGKIYFGGYINYGKSIQLFSRSLNAPRERAQQSRRGNA
jgi:hypothetical protein